MTRDRNTYRVLVMEDNPGDFVIVEDFLSEMILNPVIVHATTFKEGAGILTSTNHPFDIILLDLSLPDKSGQELVIDMLQLATVCPIIILTGYPDINFSIKSISQGILDYLLKDELNATVLYKSIIYSIERKKNISDIKASEKRYSDLFELSPQPMCLYEMKTFHFIQVNKAAINHYGYSKEEFLEMTLLDLVPLEDRRKTLELIAAQHRVLNQTYPGKSRNYKKTGELIEVETFSTPIIINGQPTTLVIAMDVTEKNQHEHNIIKAIIKTQEDERYEIGGELHDNVCQILATSKLTLGMLKKRLPLSVEPLFEQCDEYINLALTEIRNLSHRLAPAFFDDSTLEEAFVRLFDTFDSEEKIVHSIHIDKSISKYPISLEIQLNLYRILQEQLRNISKYAHAETVEVFVSVIDNELQMKISDDGVGFDVHAIKNGIGLANMKRRTELFSGKFEVISSPGNGCDIKIAIPLPDLLEDEDSVFKKPDLSKVLL